MRSFFVVLAGAAMVFAQPPAPLAPEVLQLSRIRQRMLLNLAHQPNYTCVETVERSHRSGPTRKFELLDILRLEVALVDGKEMFGWPGAKNFQDTELRNIVTTGTFGNGNFALHARSIFAGGNATFDYRGVEEEGLRYDFHVPLLLSGYKIRVESAEAVVAYHGSIWADPDSLDVRRLEVIGEDIPLRLGLSAVSDRMEYAHAKIGDGDFLLPGSSELTMTDLNGSERRNRVRFSSCRQFSGESVLTFDDAPKTEMALAPVAEMELPADLAMRLTLLDDVDLRKSAVGDPIHARLENDLRHKGKVLFGKGSTVLGRITRMDRHEDVTELGLEFSEIESAGLRAHIRAKLEEVIGLDPFSPRARRSSGAQPNPGEGIIPLNTSRTRLLHGILMFWRT
ncbi:MAG: hypothetical protein LAO79_28910 [Acidobacteriia bacterium]|nr:hypothetical protein [Terriglobia bacterium]